MLNARWEVALWNVRRNTYPRMRFSGLVLPHWAIVHVAAGRVQTETGGERAWAETGDVMVHPPNRPYGERSEVPGTHEWFLFDARIADGVGSGSADLLARFRLPAVVPLGPRSAAFSRAFSALLDAWAHGRGAEASLLTGGLLSEVMLAWAEAGRPPRPAALEPPEGRFAGVIAYMEAHLAERVTRETLASVACLQPNAFDRAFGKAHGTPPMRLLQGMRLERARRLLESEDGTTVEAAARACGLGDAARLSRLFRARFGIPPGAYRAQARAASALYLAAGAGPDA